MWKSRKKFSLSNCLYRQCVHACTISNSTGDKTGSRDHHTKLVFVVSGSTKNSSKHRGRGRRVEYTEQRPRETTLKLPMASHLHYQCSQHLSPNIAVLIIYSSNPFFAGDTIDALITFQHVDPQLQKFNPDDDSNTRHEEKEVKSRNDNDNDSPRPLGGDSDPNTENQSSWSRRISSQFSRSLFLSQLEDAEKQEDLQKSVASNTETYLSGSLQLFGYFLVNDEVIDSNIFTNLRQNSIISGCIAGVPSLKISTNEPKSFFQNLSSNFTSFLNTDLSDFDSTINHRFVNSQGPSKTTQPIFVTNQFLMFPSLSLTNGEYKQYHFRFKLPETLPSSYRSESIQIVYKLILNTEKLLGSSSRPSNISIAFPIKISLAPQTNGQQVVPNLETEFFSNKKHINSRYHLNKSNFLVELDTQEKPYTDFSFISEGSHVETKVLQLSIIDEPEEDPQYSDHLKQEFINTMKTLINEKDLITSEQIRSLPSSPLISNTNGNFQSIDSNLEYLSNNDISQFDTEKKQYESSLSGRQRVRTFSHSVSSGQFKKDLPSLNTSLKLTVEPVIKDILKTQYLVKIKNLFATKILFDKPFYKIGENISLLFDFHDDEQKLDGIIPVKVSGISISVQSFEKFRYEYLIEYQKTAMQIKEQFKENPVEAQKLWKFPTVNNNLTGLTNDEINSNESIEREIVNQNPAYWKHFTKTHTVKKYSLLGTHYKKLNINDLFLGYNLTPQFSTNFFKLKYFLAFKFILVEGSDKIGKNQEDVYLKSIHKDANGGLFSAKDSLNGSEFSIKIPINVLPSEHDFNNINV